MDRLNRITIVLAYWCPHCSPLSIEYISKVSEDLKTDCRILDIDNKEQEIIADEIVKKHGDWGEDYTIPQVFLEFNDGRIQHILTGARGGSLNDTKRIWEKLFSSELYMKLIKQ